MGETKGEVAGLVEETSGRTMAIIVSDVALCTICFQIRVFVLFTQTGHSFAVLFWRRLDCCIQGALVPIAC